MILRRIFISAICAGAFTACQPSSETVTEQVPAKTADASLAAPAQTLIRDNPPPFEKGQGIYLVRHAQKQAGDNPSLTKSGQHAAEVLSLHLREQRIEGIPYEDYIKAVYSTDYARTQETAAPIAARLGVDVQTYDPRDLPALARLLIAKGETALVVGHSNTTPEMVKALGGDAGPPIDDATEFDRIYKVLLSPTEPPKTYMWTYP